MKYISLLLIPAGLFMLWGGFFVNLPAGNIGWFVYDLILGVWCLIFTVILV